MDEAVKAELARLRDEDNRQNHRIDDLEQSVKAIQDLTISVHALAQDMRQMLSELKDQGTRLERFDGRLEALEQQPARRWQRMSDKVLDTAVGLLAGAVITGLQCWPCSISDNERGKIEWILAESCSTYRIFWWPSA